MPTMYAWLTDTQLQMIQQCLGSKDEKIKTLLDYLDRNETVGPEIGSYLKLPDVFEYCYTPVHRDTFIRRLPIYLFGLEKDEHGKLKHYDSIYEYAGRTRLDDRDDYAKDLEALYSSVEKMYYHHKISLDVLFRYPTDQVGLIGQLNVLMQWSDYLDLSEKYSIQDKTPKHLIVSYNYLLEQEGRTPLMYYLEELNNYEYIWRTQDIIEVRGIFPCDTAGRPIWRWIGLRIKDATVLEVDVNKRLKGSIKIKINPYSAIWGLNCYNAKEDQGDYWYLLYAGPMLMTFDYKALKIERERVKMTQKEVAESIGAVVRTYQKWECGDTTPDCLYLLRLLNLFDIRDISELTRVDLKVPECV